MEKIIFVILSILCLSAYQVSISKANELDKKMNLDKLMKKKVAGYAKMDEIMRQIHDKITNGQQMVRGRVEMPLAKMQKVITTVEAELGMNQSIAKEDVEIGKPIPFEKLQSAITRINSVVKEKYNLRVTHFNLLADVDANADTTVTGRRSEIPIELKRKIMKIQWANKFLNQLNTTDIDTDKEKSRKGNQITVNMKNKQSKKVVIEAKRSTNALYAGRKESLIGTGVADAEDIIMPHKGAIRSYTVNEAGFFHPAGPKAHRIIVEFETLPELTESDLKLKEYITVIVSFQRANKILELIVEIPDINVEKLSDYLDGVTDYDGIKRALISLGNEKLNPIDKQHKKAKIVIWGNQLGGIALGAILLITFILIKKHVRKQKYLSVLIVRKEQLGTIINEVQSLLVTNAMLTSLKFNKGTEASIFIEGFEPKLTSNINEIARNQYIINKIEEIQCAEVAIYIINDAEGIGRLIHLFIPSICEADETSTGGAKNACCKLLSNQKCVVKLD